MRATVYLLGAEFLIEQLKSAQGHIENESLIRSFTDSFTQLKHD